MIKLIYEDENRIPDKDKYILYSNHETKEFESYEEAVSAYKSCSGAKFLYQPDKRYFFVTLSSTGYNYHKRSTVKAHGLFIAKNINQIRKFLANEVDWYPSGGYRSDYSKFRIYTGGYGSDPICSNTDFEQFNYYVLRYLNELEKSIYLEKDFGAVDISSPHSGIVMDIPFDTSGY